MKRRINIDDLFKSSKAACLLGLKGKKNVSQYCFFDLKRPWYPRQWGRWLNSNW